MVAYPYFTSRCVGEFIENIIFLTEFSSTVEIQLLKDWDTFWKNGKIVYGN
jgi:hypothetical protein